MRCEEVRQALSLGEEAPPNGPDAEEIERHIADCPECRVFREFLRYLRVRIDHLPPAVPPPGLAARIRTAFAAGPELASGTDNPEAKSGRMREERPKMPQMPHILVVDDEPNIVRLMQVNLERQGYQVQTADNGVQALARIRERRPAMLISDVMMPEMDGFELLANIRRDPTLADLPVLMLTAKTADSDVMTGYAFGADMYLTKPFNPLELTQFVKRLLAAAADSNDGTYRV